MKNPLKNLFVLAAILFFSYRALASEIYQSNGRAWQQRPNEYHSSVGIHSSPQRRTLADSARQGQSYQDLSFNKNTDWKNFLEKLF